MKKFHVFAALPLLMAALLFTCCTSGGNGIDVESTPTQTPTSPNVSSDTITVSFNLGGEILESEEPLDSRSFGTNDLFGMNVSQSMQERTDENLASMCGYAYGYFDDLSAVVLKLAKNRYYHFEMVYIPNGKNLIHQYSDGHYANPFECIFSQNPYNGKLNEVVYSTENGLSMLEYGASQGKGIEDYRIQANQFNQIERYQGLKWNFHATEDSKTVTVNLYRMMVGIKLIVDDFKEGEIIVSSGYGIKYSLKPAANSTTNILDIVVEMPSMPNWSWNNIGEDTPEKPFEDECIGTLLVSYKDKDGNELPLYSNSNFKYKRLTRHVLQFSLSDAITNGGITPVLKDESNGKMEDSEWSWDE